MKYQYYQVFQEYEHTSERRLVYTFDNENSAHALVECIIQNDFMPTNLIVVSKEGNETTA